MKLYVAIPVMDEPDHLPRCLDALAEQDLSCFETWVCVNQLDSWWGRADKQSICMHNQETLKWLPGYNRLSLRVLDNSSRGEGWADGAGGVGRARKVLMDTICADADKDDIVVSLDADTLFEKNYLSDLVQALNSRPKSVGITVPYFHKLTGDEKLDRAILRYEIYMRYFVINLWRIASPYAFTALGSATAFRVSAYKAVGGMSPRESGEDFYFLQKLVKQGALMHWCSSRVYPSSRYSDRVVFGTGRAVSNGADGNWSAYPIFLSETFDRISETTELFPRLYIEDVETPLTAFMKKQLGTDDPWGPLRSNHSSSERFVRACNERLDGLRIFQYLRSVHVPGDNSDEKNMMHFLKQYYADRITKLSCFQDQWTFATASIDQLDAIRCFLSEIEDECRQCL